MASTRQKGNLFQSWTQKWLEERNWIVHNQKTVSKQIPIKGKIIWVSQRQDIFSCFDLIAKKYWEENKYCVTLWIQVTLHKSLKEKVKKIEASDLPFDSSEFPMIFMKREKHIDIYGFDEIGQMVHPNEPTLYGKIIRRKFYASEGVKFEF